MSDSALNDRPLETRESDSLGVAVCADGLADFIAACQTPMTIGIQGDWGIGKSSMIGMIQDRLAPRRGRPKKYAQLLFNSWHFSLFGQEAYLTVAFIDHLVTAVAKTFGVEGGDRLDGARNAVKRLFRSVQVGVPGTTIQFQAKDLLGQETSAERVGYIDSAAILLEFRNRFEGLVAEGLKDTGHDRLVVYVDDLDRLRPVRALELLETLKNFVEIPGCVFVLAVDFEVIQWGMAEKFGEKVQLSSGKSFFDKIIQVPFAMPVSSYEIDGYLISLLREVGFLGGGDRDLDSDERSFLKEITEVSIGRNPRSIKRVANYAGLLEQIRKQSVRSKEQDGRDNRISKRERQALYTMICLQVAWPELFQHFAKNPTASTLHRMEDWAYVEAIPGIRKLFARFADEEQLKSSVSAFVDRLFGMLDENGNGHVDDSELKPLLKVLELARLTGEQREDPMALFVHTARNNLAKHRGPVADAAGRVLDGLIAPQSAWRGTGRLAVKPAGRRYATIAAGRRQVGSIVTLAGNPLVVRLVAGPQELSGYLAVDEDVLQTIIPVEDASLTGFGDWRLDLTGVAAGGDGALQRRLNALAGALQEWAKIGGP